MENSKYPQMDRSNRAKQFMPFDALKGFQEALREKERKVDSMGQTFYNNEKAWEVHIDGIDEGF